MRRYRIGLIPGDGIGPEVLAEAEKVMAASAAAEGFGYDVVRYPHSGGHYLATGELVTDELIEEWRGLDAVLLGAIGHPDVEAGLVERSVILGLRFGLDLFVNQRPVRLYDPRLSPLREVPDRIIDFVVVRENTEGLYSQIGGHVKAGLPQEVAVVTGVYTRHGTERVIRYAFELARSRRRQPGDDRPRRVTMVDKANAIRPHDIWTRVFEEVAREYPDIETDHAYVDACCMWLVTRPEAYDVIVTTNLFGDILSDLGSALQGGLGLAASGNIHPGKTSMFEPVHGSAPKYAGQGVASPLAAIASAGMMLEYLGEGGAARRIEDAIAYGLISGEIPSVSAASGLSTSAIGDMLVGWVEAGARPDPERSASGESAGAGAGPGTGAATTPTPTPAGS